MAFPTLNMLSYWFMWPAFISLGAAFFVEGGAAKAGWTSYTPLALTDLNAQTLWLIGLLFVGVSSMMGSVNYMTTIIQMRAPGMTMFRLPLTIWAMFITAILQAMALPVLTVALIFQLLDKTAEQRGQVDLDEALARSRPRQVDPDRQALQPHPHRRPASA